MGKQKGGKGGGGAGRGGGNPDEATQLEGGSHAVGNPQLEATELEATGKLEATDELEATVGKEKLEATAGSHQELAFSDDDSVKAVRKSKGGKKSSGSEEAPAVVVRRHTARLTSTAGKPKAGEKAAEPKGTWHCHKDASGTIHSCPLAKGVTFSEPQSKTPFLSIPF